jgi:hypothetical protein
VGLNSLKSLNLTNGYPNNKNNNNNNKNNNKNNKSKPYCTGLFIYLTSNTNCYFKYQLLLQIPKLLLRIPIVTSNTKIGTLNTNCYLKYQLLLEIPIVTSNSNLLPRMPKLVLQIPIITSITNCYFQY